MVDIARIPPNGNIPVVRRTVTVPPGTVTPADPRRPLAPARPVPPARPAASAASSSPGRGEGEIPADLDEAARRDPKLAVKYALIQQLLIDPEDRAEAGRPVPDRDGVEVDAAQPPPAAVEAPAVVAPSTAAPQAAPAVDAVAVSVHIEFQIVTVNNVEIRQAVLVEETRVQAKDPIVLDLDGDGIELTSVQGGARYDLTGDGVAEQAATVTGGDAFLVMDRDSDGRIDGGAEFFGDQHGAANGFAELAKFDGNADGVIDAADSAYASLAVFQDRDGDGVADADEVTSLAASGIASLSLAYQESAETVAGNRIAQVSAYRRTDGTAGAMGDALLNYVA